MFAPQRNVEVCSRRHARTRDILWIGDGCFWGLAPVSTPVAPYSILANTGRFGLVAWITSIRHPFNVQDKDDLQHEHCTTFLARLTSSREDATSAARIWPIGISGMM